MDFLNHTIEGHKQSHFYYIRPQDSEFFTLGGIFSFWNDIPINGIYDNAKAFSLRDRDDGLEEIEDTPPIVRMKTSCRAAEI